MMRPIGKHEEIGGFIAFELELTTVNKNLYKFTQSYSFY
jgi:hypothetical protein